MKTFKYIYIIVALFLIGCEDRLNIEDQQSISIEMALSSTEGLNDLLSGCYAALVDDSDTHFLMDLLGATDQVTWYGTFIGPRQFINKDLLSNNDYVSLKWNTNYFVINQSSLIIDNSNIIDDNEEKDRIVGEAKYLRALSYFDLVRSFAKQYSSTSGTDLGVPLRVTGVKDYTKPLDISRSSVEEVYAQVNQDLDDAIAKLPVTNTYFADKYAALALKSRVLLQQRKYEEARDAANEVIQNSGHALTLDYALAFNNDDNSAEDIFSLQITDQTGSSNLILFYASEANGGREDIWIEGAYYDTFDSPNDDRATFVTDEYDLASDGGGLTAKYTNQFANISVIRLAEMYLIRAETNFRLGTAFGDTPVNDINRIRNRAKANSLNSVDLDTILRERQYELAFEGFLIFDLKRTETNVGSINWNADNLVLPIPQAEIDSNSLITQNAGY